MPNSGGAWRSAGSESAMHADHFIGGEWRSSSDAGTLAIHDPGTGEQVGTAAFGTVEDARDGLDAARAAFHGWAATPVHERSAILRAGAALVRSRIEEMARTLTLEQGK